MSQKAPSTKRSIKTPFQASCFLTGFITSESTEHQKEH